MKKQILMVVALVFTCATTFAQDPVTRYLEERFDGSEDGKAFVRKGSRSIGIKGGFRSFNASGDESTNTGYALLSMLNIGNGQLKVWNVSPSIQYFLSNDLSLGASLDYTGYAVSTDIRLDLRDIVNSSSESLNVTLSNRAIQHHALGLSMVMRKYVPLFGSKYVAVFAEGRLQTSYGGTSNRPLDDKDYNRERVSGVISVALKAGGGLAIKLKNNNAITVSVPLFGVGYSYTRQEKTTTYMQESTDASGATVKVPVTEKSHSHMSDFQASRSLDLLGIQFGFVRFIEPKRR